MKEWISILMSVSIHSLDQQFILSMACKIGCSDIIELACQDKTNTWILNERTLTMAARYGRLDIIQILKKL